MDLFTVALWQAVRAGNAACNSLSGRHCANTQLSSVGEEQNERLTNQNYKPVFVIRLPPILRHFFVRWDVCCVVLLALLALVHGLVCFLVFPAKTEASPKTSCNKNRVGLGFSSEQEKKPSQTT